MAQTPVIDHIEGPTTVMQGGIIVLEARGTNLTLGVRHRIGWRIVGDNRPTLGRGVKRPISFDSRPPGPVTIEVTLDNVPASTRTVNVLPANWPELGDEWKFESEYVGDRLLMVTGRFTTADHRTTPWFLVGQKQRYTEADGSIRRGLAHAGIPPFYDPSMWSARIKHWANILEPIAKAEGKGSFAAINTYDWTCFTTGFIQFSAGTYNANFHELLVRLYRDPGTKAQKFVPYLNVDQNGQVRGRTPSGMWQQLTFSDRPSNDRLRAFLKPHPDTVTDIELETSARFVYWTRFFPTTLPHQVQLAFDGLYKKVFSFGKPLLDQKSDRVFVWLADILNQGWTGRNRLREALASANPEQQLERLKAERHATRAAHLARSIASATNLGRRYDAATDSFV